MKHRTLRCAAETLVLLLIAAMAVFLAAGLHQHAPDGALSTLSTGWYQLTDGVRREVTLPAALETGPGQTITLYNDTLTDSDGGKVLSARGVEYGIEIRAGETLLYRYEDNAFPKNTQMKGRLWADTELPYGIGGQTLSLTFTELPGRMCRIDAPVLGSMPAVTGRHIQSSLFSAGMILVMLVLAVLALLIFLYMSFYGIRERRFLDTAVFLLLCSLWCLTDSGLYQLYGADTAAGSVVSFYAFMTMAIPMVHFVRNTVSGRLRLVPDVLIALLCVNALAQGAAYRLFGVPFIDMLPLTHLLLTAGVAAMLTVLFRSYREQPAPQFRLRIAAFAALGAFGVAALVLYWLLHIYWYDAVYQFGVLLFIILLLHGLISQAAGIGLCLDDFGSGYANLNTVMQLPFSVIKLDRSLLFHICTDKNAALFYQSIVSAFCRLGYRIVAEGVETQEEMELLRSWNVDMIQGYYFSRPLPPDDLLRLLTGSAETQAENQA